MTQSTTKALPAMAEEFDPYRKWLGIPLQDQPPHHYRLLGIAPFEDDPDVIENAATRQMAHVRTFQTGRHAALSQRLLTELTNAKLCLLLPEKKSAYDEQLQEQLNGEERQPTDLFVPSEPTLIRSPGSRWKVGNEQFASEPPPPVPLRMPAAVTSSSMPIVVTSSGHSSHRPRRKQSVLPLIITAACLLMVTIGGLVAIVVGSGALVGKNLAAPQELPSHQEDAAPEPAPVATPFPVGSAVVQESDTQPLTPATSNLPAGSGSQIPIDEQIRSLLWQARNSLAARDDDAWRKNLSEAELLIARHHPSGQQEMLREAEHLNQMKAHLDAFWTAVREAILKHSRPGEKLEFAKRESIELVRKQGDVVTYKLNGETGEATIRKLPPRVAVPYALRDGRTNPATLASAAAFLAIDADASQEVGNHRIAVKLYQEAVALGQRDAALMQELGKRGEGRLNLDAPLTSEDTSVNALPETSSTSGSGAGTPPKPAATDPMHADPAMVREVRQRIVAEHREPLAAAHQSTDAATSLIESFTALAEKDTSAVAKQAYLEESLDLAVRWCLMEQIDTLCDSLAASRKSDALDMKAFYCDRCEPKTSAQAGALQAKVSALAQQAGEQKKIETALKFTGISVKAAVALKLLEFGEQLKQ